MLRITEKYDNSLDRKVVISKRYILMIFIGT
jgi:hypothetical protein